MPGFVIAVGCTADDGDALVDEFCRAWPTARVFRAARVAAAAHAFAPHLPLVEHAGRVHVVDGEFAAYAAMARRLAAARQRCVDPLDLWELLPSDAVCSAATIDPERGDLGVRVDWTGSFPIYVGRRGGGVMVSTLLRPLARVVRAEPDPSALAQYLSNGFVVGDRSLFRGIRRLRPGEVCRITNDGAAIATEDRSGAWLERDAASDRSPAETADEVWERLGRAVAGLSVAGTTGLMMSAGWDSRTILAVLLDRLGAASLLAYSHGNPASRELSLVREIAKACGIVARVQPLSGSMYVAHELRESFERTEAIHFPHWCAAGRELRASGCDVGTAGIYGEVLGGHYGPSALEPRGLGQMRHVAAALLWRGASRPRRTRDSDAALVDRIAERLRPRRFRLATGDLADGSEHFVQELRADVADAVARLRARGVTGTDRLVEAFLCEHRGTQCINMQSLALRAHVDVALPFSHESVMSLASAIPLPLKIHNALNRVMLLRHAPALLRHASAATLVPASAPIVVQEASRLARRVSDAAAGRLHDILPGVVGKPRSGWYDLEFAKAPGTMTELVADLRAPVWNRGRVAEHVARLESADVRARAAPVVEALVKAYEIDLMLR